MALLDSCVIWNELNSSTNLLVDKLGITTLVDNNTVTTNPGPASIPTAAQFTRATSEYMSAADSAQLSGADVDSFWLAWAYMDSKPAGDVTLMSKYVGTGNQREFDLGWDNGDTFILVVSGDGTVTVQVAATTFGAPSLATWYCVMAYHDSVNNLIGISVNNGAFNTAAHTTGIFNGTGAFAIGARSVPNQYWDGRIAQAIYWKGRIPAAAEQTQLFNSGNALSFDMARSLPISSRPGTGTSRHPGRTMSNRSRFSQTKQGHTIVTPAVTTVFRKTLSRIGTRTGSRQTHND